MVYTFLSLIRSSNKCYTDYQDVLNDKHYGVCSYSWKKKSRKKTQMDSCSCDSQMWIAQMSCYRPLMHNFLLFKPYFLDKLCFITQIVVFVIKWDIDNAVTESHMNQNWVVTVAWSHPYTHTDTHIYTSIPCMCLLVIIINHTNRCLCLIAVTASSSELDRVGNTFLQVNVSLFCVVV